MKKFDNITSEGNEKAIRRGKKVPDGDVNLAWVKSPAFSPDNNMVILDTSNMVPENTQGSDRLTKLFYSNNLGILQDEFGNEVMQDEYPAITDEFTVEENYEITDENEFLNSHILPFRHVSRYFHVDQEGLAIKNQPATVVRSKIRVEDEDGKEYLDSSGNRKYKIKLVQAIPGDLVASSESGTTEVYRVWAYVDVDSDESLYLRYNKVELSAGSSTIKNQNINYREILNPQSFFKYVPEESDVADSANENEKIFTTKSSTHKEQIIGVPRSGMEGYKVFVPKKGIEDPRLFQAFRWRVKANFEERYTVDPTTSQQVIRAGILTYNYPDRTTSDLSSGSVNYNYLKPPTQYPYVFFNMEKSAYNPSGAKIVNPLSEDRGYTIVEDVEPSVQNPSDGNTIYNNSSFQWSGNVNAPLKSVSGEEAKEYAAYWVLDIDTVSEDSLRKFDILLLDLATFPGSDISSYMPKLMKFTRGFGGALYVKAEHMSSANSFGLGVSQSVHPYTGSLNTRFPSNGPLDSKYGLGATIAASNAADAIFNGLTPYGGWDFSQDEFNSVSPFIGHPNVLYSSARSYVSIIHTNTDPTPTDDDREYWKALFTVKDSSSATRYPTTVIKRFDSGGSIIVDTQGIITECGKLEDSSNIAPRRLQIPNYFNQINAARFEGSYKFGWNFILSTIKSRPLDSSDQSGYVSSWSFETEWLPSWVINGTVLKEKEKLQYSFNYEPQDASAINKFSWRRKLAYGLSSSKSPIFKTLKELVDEQIVKEMGADFLRSISTNQRSYVLEVNNMNVSVPTTLSGDMYPYAWTESFSPAFVVPEGFGPHIIKDDPITAEYAAGQYIDRSYPSNKFAVKVKASSRETVQANIRQTTTILARYRGKEVLRSGQMYAHVRLPRTWTEHGSNQISFNRFNKGWGAPRPNAILTRNELLMSRTTAYPFAGIAGNYTLGSSGEVVRFIQYALGRLSSIVSSFLSQGANGPTPSGMTRSEGYAEASTWALRYVTGSIPQTGVYDNRTYQAVAQLKQLAGARYQDGIADSEFFAILGSQIQFWGLTTEVNQNTNTSGAFETNPYNHLKYTSSPDKYMDLRSVSDSSFLYNYSEMSDSRRNLDRISDIFLLQYPKTFAFEYVSITPYLLGLGSNVQVDFVDIQLTRIDTTRFTGDMLNKAWQYFQVEERPGGGSGWVPDSPRVLWAQNPQIWAMNNVKQTTWDYNAWPGITKTPVTYSELDFFGAANRVAFVKMIQRAVNVYPDGNYGSATAAAVRRWKETRAYQWGIPVDSNWGVISSVTSIQRLLHLTEDGYYGPGTERAVRDWQARWNGAMPIDGFWGPITQKFTDELFIYLGGTPTVQRIQKHLPQPYFIKPEDLLLNYDPSRALVKNINRTAPSGQMLPVQIPQDNRSIGNTLIIGVSSTSRAGSQYNNQVELGISDITGYGRDIVGFTTISGGDAIIDYEGVVRKTFTLIGDMGPIQLNHNYTETGAPGTLTDVVWGVDPISEVSTSISPNFNPLQAGLYRLESSNPNVEAFITADGKLYLRTDEVVNNAVDQYSEGRWLPGPPDRPLEGQVVSYSSRSSSSTTTLDVSTNPIYAMNENGRIFPGVETGFISKADGIKLLCTSDGRPVGIPVFPTSVGPNERQRHYVELELEPYVTSPFVRIGFYDKQQKEFIVNKDGGSKLSYIEYIKRGAQNIYIGVISEAEILSKQQYPKVLDGLNELPFKYAMPVYGGSLRGKSKIGIERIDSTLGASDPWGIPVRSGSFNRNVKVPSSSAMPIGGWLSEYQGKTLQAFYSIPEANDMGWSPIFGRPYVDVKQETPEVISRDVIRIRQAPIVMIVEPTQFPSLADPQRPMLKVWTRESTSSAWVEVAKSDILDYNVSNGLVYLRNPIQEEDENLVRVDYTTISRVYTVKNIGLEKINLNPYLKAREDLIGVPVYVYIIPQYVRNEDGDIIQESISSSVINVTPDNSVINPYNPLYNPLAIQIGVIFVTASAKIEDLVMIDTRRRGGGARDSLEPAEVFNKNSEAKAYWDIGFGAGQSFQYGGLVIVRLPKMLKTAFPDTKQVEEVIRRNIPAGVEFIIEDLEGRPWNE